MPRLLFAAIAGFMFLAACDGKNPFMEETDPDPTEELEPGDPNTDVNSQFLWDPARGFTMNSVEYDETNDELVINNLPFDGPDGRYDHVADMTNGTGIYRSRETPTTGQITHYAVFMRSDYMDAAAAAGVEWIGYGNQGANVNRADFDLPTRGEYIYLGEYAGLRSFSEKSGLELTAGDLRLILDISDFDPADGIQGDITGVISNHHTVGFDGTNSGSLPTVFLSEVQFSTNQGVFEGGGVSTFNPYTGEPWSSGSWDGLLAGVPGSQEIGGYISMEGVADIQQVTYEIVNWTLTVTDLLGNVFVTTGQTSGLELINQEAYQAAINAGANLPAFVAAPALPDGAVETSTSSGTIIFETEYNAQEIGVFLGDCVAPCDGLN